MFSIQMNESIAFFDFCETLVDFQTADAYVDFVREETHNRRMRVLNIVQLFLIRIKLIRVLAKLFPNNSINKRLKLFQLKGFKDSELETLANRYYKERIKPHIIHILIKELELLKSRGFSVGLVSGGYSIYLKFFVEEYSLDFCISSRIAFNNGSCTGKLEGVDCLRANKITLIEKEFEHKIKDSVAFSDSKSDLPLLLYARNGFVVSHNHHQEWVEKYDLKEIIWEDQNN